jgi:hypothetical protein
MAEENVFDQLLELQTRAAMLQPTAVTPRQPPARTVSRITQAELDATIEGSFPASDPPSWTAAIARPAPERTRDADGRVRRLLRRAAACF